MKKLPLFLFLFLLCQLSNAQENINDHSFILGGSMNFIVQKNTQPFVLLNSSTPFFGSFSNNQNNSKYTLFSLNPYIGQRINSNWLFGLQFNFRFKKSQSTFINFSQEPTSLKTKANHLGFSFFGRYTLSPESKFQFFLKPYIAYLIINEESQRDSFSPSIDKGNVLDLGADLGVLFPINDRLNANIVIGGLRYINGNWKRDGTDKKEYFSSLGTNLNLTSLRFGIEIKL